jgi:hypothetical protein
VKKPKNYSRAKRIYCKPEIKVCPYCGSQLKRSHTTCNKKIFTLNQTLHIISHAYKCTNQKTVQTQKKYTNPKNHKKSASNTTNSE